MPRFLQRFVLLSVVCTLIAVGLVAWALATGSSQAQSGTMHNCPPPGQWAISVWDGPDGTETSQALATCGDVAIAYWLDPQTGGWLWYSPARAGMSSLLTLNNGQGIIALGGATGAAGLGAAGAASAAQSGTMHNCPLAGNWAISVWDGADGTETSQALAPCGDVAVAYWLDPQTGGWLWYSPARAGMSSLLTLNNGQGIIALGGLTGAPTQAATPTPTPTAMPTATPTPTPTPTPPSCPPITAADLPDLILRASEVPTNLKFAGNEWFAELPASGSAYAVLFTDDVVVPTEALGTAAALYADDSSAQQDLRTVELGLELEGWTVSERFDVPGDLGDTQRAWYTEYGDFKGNWIGFTQGPVMGILLHFGYGDPPSFSADIDMARIQEQRIEDRLCR